MRVSWLRLPRRPQWIESGTWKYSDEFREWCRQRDLFLVSGAGLRGACARLGIEILHEDPPTMTLMERYCERCGQPAVGTAPHRCEAAS